jgi:hypothetical protein
MTFLWEFEEKHPKQVSAYGTQSWVGVHDGKVPQGRLKILSRHAVPAVFIFCSVFQQALGIHPFEKE